MGFRSNILLLFTIQSEILTVILGHFHPAYDHEYNGLKPHSPVAWMKDIPDDTKISKISIPGTHDSFALHGTPFAICQTSDLSHLLHAGIRVLDARCYHNHDRFPIHHGEVFQKIFFDDVLEGITQFLSQYKTETIFMKVQEEKPKNLKGENTRRFNETFYEYLQPYKQFHHNPTSGKNAVIGELRGKFVILANNNEIYRYGINWNTLDNEDNWEMDWRSMPDSLYKKWEEVKTHLKKANKDQGDTNMFVTHLSGSGAPTITPFFVASAHILPGNNADRLPTGSVGEKSCQRKVYKDFPRNFCVLPLCPVLNEGTNILTQIYISKRQVTFTGIVIADFPGKALIDSIIKLNFK